MRRSAFLTTNAQKRLRGPPPTINKWMQPVRFTRWERPPDDEHLRSRNWPGPLGLQRMKAIAEYRFHSMEFKRQCAQEFIAGSAADTTFPQPDPNRGAEV